MQTADFDFHLPPELIAQTPASERDRSRLLVVERRTQRLDHRCFRDLPDLLNPGDLLVLNDSRVVPARLRARKIDTGGPIELLLLEQTSPNSWWAMVRPGKRVRPGTELVLLDRTDERTAIRAVALEKNEEGHCRFEFTGTSDLMAELPQLGEVPLPPYITRPAQSGGIDDSNRYQTVYARTDGSVAAPTAGLHFTPEILDRIRASGVGIAYVTLHVGLGTFAPVKADRVEEHRMHEERYTVSDSTAEAIRNTKQSGGRVIGVGTTTMRVLESVAAENEGRIVPGAGRTRIFIYPPYRFRTVDALLTNFHLPRSTLLMLVSAFAAPEKCDGRELILRAYAEAVREQYRFFSYGDATLIL